MIRNIYLYKNCVDIVMKLPYNNKKPRMTWQELSDTYLREYAMNLFEFCTKLNHKKKEKGWVEVTATFTGKRNVRELRTKAGYIAKDFHEYEIEYPVNGEKMTGWHVFYPAPEPEADEIKGETIRIKYHEKKPWRFETVEEELDFDCD